MESAHTIKTGTGVQTNSFNRCPGLSAGTVLFVRIYEKWNWTHPQWNEDKNINRIGDAQA
jgi:hypothetical protein